MAGVVMLVEWKTDLGAPVLALGIIAGTRAVGRVQLEYHRLEPPAEG